MLTFRKAMLPPSWVWRWRQQGAPKRWHSSMTWILSSWKP